MAVERGTAFLLKLGRGDTPLSYQTVAGLKTKELTINGEAVEKPEKRDGWRELLSGARTRSMGISASGIFVGSAAEAAIRGKALAGEVDDYELSFESGEQFYGRFLITRLEYAGDFNGERNYTLALESSGEVRPR
jgi:TP901-1 family phage major tail protein